LRERYDEITGLGADVVAVGTGDRRYAEAFVRDEQIPFLVLVDDDAAAARAARRRSAATTPTRRASG
jgi:peroxiredoxin